MDVKADSRRCLNADQTKAVLLVMDGLPNRLRDLEQVKLDTDESCRALLANFIYAWSVADASGLVIMTELAEIGIVEMSARLGLDIKKESHSASWYSRERNLNLKRVPN